MRVRILDLARNDLIEGFHFYEDREKGLGAYFLTSLCSDIEALNVYGDPSKGLSNVAPGPLEEVSVHRLL